MVIAERSMSQPPGPPPDLPVELPDVDFLDGQPPGDDDIPPGPPPGPPAQDNEVLEPQQLTRSLSQDLGPPPQAPPDTGEQLTGIDAKKAEKEAAKQQKQEAKAQKKQEKEYSAAKKKWMKAKAQAVRRASGA